MRAQVAGFEVGVEYDAHFQRLYKAWLQELAGMLSPRANFPALCKAGGKEREFVRDLAAFIAAFFRVRSCLHPGWALHLKSPLQSARACA